ncbi:hybrid sensor histidine kinase/response regulator [uncultured Thalassolituus sp.]|uniref:ATP-binding response regulator n=1 Tax=uncultured Thalassolituus sp. TaxID=285273 RepID=UPI00261504E0|nr:hybrid sensor histidine kinase/response regulator [uncultured Thalassolituus sp.]
MKKPKLEDLEPEEEVEVLSSPVEESTPVELDIGKLEVPISEVEEEVEEKVEEPVDLGESGMDDILGKLDELDSEDSSEEKEPKKSKKKDSADDKGMDDLLGKLLDISRLDAGDVKADISTFALDSLIGSIVREATPVAEEKSLTLVAIPCECIVRSDPVLLGNILRNLIANAIKYTESGTITVGTEPSQTEDGKFITRLYVRDTGMGIPQDQQDHIFQEFVQLNNPERDRQKGLGLGLSVCRRLSDLLGHSLRLVSSPGLGSEFSLDIELVSENIAPAVAESYASGNPVGDFTGTPVLLVEDDAMVRQSTSELLAGWGCDVRAFADATTCIQAVGESPGWGDILITDFRLPGEMDGQELTGKVRQLTGRHLPVLMVTGDTAPERIKALSSSGMAVLHKPVKPAFLRNAMRQILTQ